MNILAALILGHLIGDFPLQTNRIAQSKHENQSMLVIHVLIHVCVTAALIKNPFDNVLLLTMIGCAHYLIDLTKFSNGNSGPSRCFLFDQVIHLTSLSLIALTTMYIPNMLPINALPVTILYPALAYGLLLGSMVFTWVWANESTVTTASHNQRVWWVRSRMLVLSQRAGVALLGLVVIALFAR